MSFRDALLQTLAEPSPEGLWRLRGAMLEAGLPTESRAWEVIDRFRAYLDRLDTGGSSRDYSNLASKLDISAVGGVVLEQVLESDRGEDLAMRLFTGMLSEGLMMLATRQHVRAWEGELNSVHGDAAWYLYGELWRWAEARKPDLPKGERRMLLDRLLGPAVAPDTAGESKALLLGRLFQVLLLSELSSELDRLRA